LFRVVASNCQSQIHASYFRCFKLLKLREKKRNKQKTKRNQLEKKMGKKSSSKNPSKRIAKSFLLHAQKTKMGLNSVCGLTLTSVPKVFRMDLFFR
jgi:hypothetical protein